MKIVNTLGLPHPLYLAVKHIVGAYDNKGSYLSCSAVLKPVRIFHLERRHWNEIEVEAMDLIPSFLGTLQHNACEAAAEGLKEFKTEERLSATICGEKFSGQYDLFEIEDSHLKDYKQTTSFQVMKEKEEWPAQLSCLRWLLHKDGVKTKSASIEATIRDFSPSKAMYDKKYPNERHINIPIKLWTLKGTEQFLKDRVTLYKSYENTPDEELPICSQADRWSDGDVWAVYKDKKVKRALKLHSDEMSAKIHAMNVGGIIEFRKGFDRRCRVRGYCNVRNFCNYWIENYKDEKSNP